MAAKTNKTTATKRGGRTKKTTSAKKTPGTKRAATATQATRRTRDAAVVAAAAPTRTGTDADLARLREATQSVYERLREIDDDALPPDKTEEYWRDRHIARTAWEHAENADFERLVEQQKEQLPAVSESSAKLAKDVQTTATVIGVLNVVSAALGILASVIALLA